MISKSWPKFYFIFLKGRYTLNGIKGFLYRLRRVGLLYKDFSEYSIALLFNFYI